VDEVAIPLEPVVSVSLAEPFANVPLAPEAGAEKVTVTPLTGDPLLVTTAENFCPNAVPTTVFCCEPLASDNLSDDDDDDDELELAQPERTTRAATQVIKAKILNALPPNCTFCSGLQGTVETPAGFCTKPRSLMSLVLVGSDPGFNV